MVLSRLAHRGRAYRPHVEVLEARHLLSTYVVDNLGDSGAGSGLAGDLRYCITQAADGDAITFSVTGTINLAGALPDLTHSISIEGPGASLMTVRGTTFTVASGTTVSICGLTITRIDNAGTLTVSNCAINHGNAEDGGDIDNTGTLTVSNCTITNGYAEDGGGGIYNEGTLTLSNSTVAGNRAGSDYGAIGGGIYNLYGDLTVNYSTISGNTARYANFDSSGGYGGGIGNQYGTLTISNSTISGNQAGQYIVDNGSDGGGMYNDTGTLTLNNATVSGNSVAAGGGAVGTAAIVNFDGFGDSTLTLNNSTVRGNQSDGIVNWGTLTLNNATISGNRFGDVLNVGLLHARNTIISDLNGSLGSLGHNLIGDGTYGSGYDPTDLVGTDANPIDPLLGPLQDNGGPTQTMALEAGSPALNAGDPAELGVADQRGVVRTGGVNIGAYQASATAFIVNAPDTVQSGVPFDVTVTAVDPFGQVALGYTGTVTFSTSDGDPNVVLPADYTFTPDDQGTHTFGGGVTLATPGDQVVSATDTSDDTVAGSATVTVTGGAATPGRQRGAEGLAAADAPTGDRRAADAGQALAAGFFDDPDQVAHWKQDGDLAPLRPWEGFRRFAAALDAVMPAE
jgi:hypothetical protein